MNDLPGCGAGPEEPPKQTEPSKPKRGAFPTPKSEIEKAKPYIPGFDGEDESSEEAPDNPTDADREQEE